MCVCLSRFDWGAQVKGGASANCSYFLRYDWKLDEGRSYRQFCVPLSVWLGARVGWKLDSSVLYAYVIYTYMCIYIYMHKEICVYVQPLWATWDHMGKYVTCCVMPVHMEPCGTLWRKCVPM